MIGDVSWSEMRTTDVGLLPENYTIPVVWFVVSDEENRKYDAAPRIVPNIWRVNGRNETNAE